MVPGWTVSEGCDPQVYVFDHLITRVFCTENEYAILAHNPHHRRSCRSVYVNMEGVFRHQLIRRASCHSLSCSLILIDNMARFLPCSQRLTMTQATESPENGL